MRNFLQNLLNKPIGNLANRISSRPDKKRVDKALSALYKEIKTNPGKRGLVLPFDVYKGKIIILSDQHKGARNGADIFAKAEKNYLAALEHYYESNFLYINLGDSEELWENFFVTVKKYNKATFEIERKFLDKKSFIKIFGNHDLYWDNDPLASINLKKVYGRKIRVYEGVVLKCNNYKRQLEVYLTHGHQGDLQSDGDWFSKWFVSNIWAPFQAYLSINPNTPANSNELKTAHNRMMYQWSAKHKNMLLITGHTHQPVFKSLTHLEKLMEELGTAKKEKDEKAISQLQKQINSREIKGDKLPGFTGYLDTYFNSGCCCFDDGDITGIELENGFIRLVKWRNGADKNSERLVLEESKLDELKVG